MIKLKDLINEYWLVLTEDNSGYTDHKLHKYISDKIFNCWMELLEEVNDKDNTIENILTYDQDYFKKQIDDGNFFDINESDPEMNIQTVQKINVLLALTKEKKYVVINGASINVYSTPIEIYLQVNPDYSVREILDHRKYIEGLAYHEAVHLIKFIQKLYQISIKGNDKTPRDQEWYTKYLTQTQEIHAYIAQLNNELKHINEKYKNISFGDALDMSKIYYRYKRDIFPKNPKLKNKMLSKLANYWNRL